MRDCAARSGLLQSGIERPQRSEHTTARRSRGYDGRCAVLRSGAKMADKLKGLILQMGGTLDLFGVCGDVTRLHRHEHTMLGALVTDAEALAGDWRRVGDDMRAGLIAEIYGTRTESTRKEAS